MNAGSKRNHQDLLTWALAVIGTAVVLAKFVVE